MLSALVIFLWLVCLLTWLGTSKALAAQWQRIRSVWRSMGIPARTVAIVALSLATLYGGSKSPNPILRMFDVLFWDPGRPWQLASVRSAVDTAQAAVAVASDDLDYVEAETSTTQVWTVSFDWHAPDRLPARDRQNIMGWTAQVVPTNINGTLFEDHYVAFNSQASTNPAVILIEYAARRDDGTVERQSARVVTNSYPQTSVVNLQSGAHTCYWFRVAVPEAFTNSVRDWSGEALFGAPEGSGKGFDLLGTLVVDDGNNVWVGATTNIVLAGATNEFINGINVTGSTETLEGAE